MTETTAEKEACAKKCETCELECRDRTGPNALPEKAKIHAKHVILVLSGKGGVGKSTVAVNLAWSLSSHGFQVGILDLDIHGPNIPIMLGIQDHKLQAIGNMIEPVKITGNLSAMSMAFLLPDVS
ncbi:MAG TPA: P-loop NTPase, partial [Methanomicrobiales archaeon]|nr:P-loop NTPase [Methanomicrobiales archaeon]